MFDAPWHKAFPPEEISPNYPGAPTKRVPIRGIVIRETIFFTSSLNSEIFTTKAISSFIS